MPLLWSQSFSSHVFVQRKDFPSNSFYVVVVVKTEDEACGGPLRFYPLQPDELIDAGNRTKDLDVMVSPAINCESLLYKYERLRTLTKVENCPVASYSWFTDLCWISADMSLLSKGEFLFSIDLNQIPLAGAIWLWLDIVITILNANKC